MDDKIKRCEICGEVKPLSEFSKSYKNRCKKCVAEETRSKRHGNIHERTLVVPTINWEQRRYEIAKDILPFIATSTKEILWQGRGLGEEVNDITVQDYCAKHAIFYADALIEELKRK